MNTSEAQTQFRNSVSALAISSSFFFRSENQNARFWQLILFKPAWSKPLL